MPGMFEVDPFSAKEHALLQKYHTLVASSFIDDLGSHPYRITILDGRRNRQLYSLPPPKAPNEQPHLSGPPRICHILSNGVHVHQYDGSEARRTLRIIEVQPSDQMQTAIPAKQQ